MKTRTSVMWFVARYGAIAAGAGLIVLGLVAVGALASDPGAGTDFCHHKCNNWRRGHRHGTFLLRFL